MPFSLVGFNPFGVLNNAKVRSKSNKSTETSNLVVFHCTESSAPIGRTRLKMDKTTDSTYLIIAEILFSYSRILVPS